jgi:hypothetical protein
MPTDTDTQVALATRAQEDMDALVRSGTVAGAAALAPFRAAVRRALRASRTPEELRHHLLELVYAQSAEKLATQLARARLLARLGGSVAVQDEVEGRR